MRPTIPQLISYFLEEHLQLQIAYIRWIWQIYLRSIFLFQRSTCSHTLEWYHHYFRRPLAVIYYLQRYCVSFKQALAVIPFFISIELIKKLPFFYYNRVIAATHSFKFTVFLQNKNFSKEILTIIIIPPWFQACIYWKKVSYVTTSFYNHPFFSMSLIISREHLKQSSCQGNCV